MIARFTDRVVGVDDEGAQRLMSAEDAGLRRVDRIAANGDIREHYVHRGDLRRALCGVSINMTQPACGNAPCRRCADIASRQGHVRTSKQEKKT